MNQFKIFVVEDNDWYRSLIEHHLSKNPNNEITVFETGEECINNLHLNPHAITLDYSLPDGTGEEILRKIKSHNPEIDVIVISGQEDVSTALKLLRVGAYDYLVKDEETNDRLWNTINNLREKAALKSEINDLQDRVKKEYDFQKHIIGNSPAIIACHKYIEKGTKSNITVSITGETGTGKELIARAIHFGSIRASKPFVAVNVSAIPENLVESELFGAEKGAFTGAVSRQIGKFEEANGGTLFLDEIGEMSLAIQAKILRVLQEKELTRLGGSNAVKLDVRIITATHKNLADLVKKGEFREDLYYRLLGLTINLPSLRSREQDIIVLAKHFLKEAIKENKLKPLSFSTQAQQKLMSYHFPGNVRELKAIVDLAAVMADEEIVEKEHIIYNSELAGENVYRLDITMEEHINNIIKCYLQKNDNNVLKTADLLKISKSRIYNLLKANRL